MNDDSRVIDKPHNVQKEEITPQRGTGPMRGALIDSADAAPVARDEAHRQRTTSVTKKINLDISDLYGGLDAPRLPDGPTTMSTEWMEEVRLMFLHEYAKGIDELFETNWYASKGVEHFIRDAHICGPFASLLEILQNTKAGDFETARKLPLLESKVLWHLICIPRFIAEKARAAHMNPFEDPQLEEVLHRLSILEHLICNRAASGNVFTSLRNCNLSVIAVQDRQLRFWRLLARLVALPSTQRTDVEACLGELRRTLECHENRDVLYSIAIVRHFGLSPFAVPMNIAQATKGQQDRNSLAVARKFIEDEAGQDGTTEVFRRLCGMVVRSWIVMG